MLLAKENVFNNINFSTFTHALSMTLKESLEQFWGKSANVYLQAVNEFEKFRQEKIITGVDFFSSKINIENHKPVTVRLSKKFVEDCLGAVFMSQDIAFNLASLTQLEVKILNNFSEYLYKNLKDNLISPEKLKLTEKSEKNTNLIFLVSLGGNMISHLAISVPTERLKTEKLNKTPVFVDDDFAASAANVRLHIGSSRITLEDLESLSCDDIILLENSSLTNATVISGDYRQNFKIKINSSLIMEQNELDGDEEMYEEVAMEKNLWDDIQIEVNAEFEKVKMTIGELKQISEGQIIDLGSVLENEISLFVENKKVANGELIIINDRYAVRLNKILSNDSKSKKPEVKTVPKTANAEKAVSQKTPAKQAKPQNTPPKRTVEDEEFDYSDFEK